MSRITTFEYDPQNGLLSRMLLAGQAVEIQRPTEVPAGESDAQITEDGAYTVVSRGGSTTRLLIENGSLIREISKPDGWFVRTEYNHHRQPVRVSGSGGLEMSIVYDEWGNVIKRRDEGRNVTEEYHYVDGRLVRQRDGAGRIVRSEYDERGNLLRRLGTETAATGEIREVVLEDRRYDAAGQLVEVSQAGVANRLVYDEYGNPSRRSTGAETPTELVNDEAGNVVEERDGRGIIRRLYDPFNRLLEVDDNGAVTRYEYDELKRLTAVALPGGSRTSYERDERGRVTRRTDSKGNVWSYGWTEGDRLETVTKPDGTQLSYAYDERGNLLEVDAGTETLTRAYDSEDRLVAAANGLCSLERTYDALGRLQEEAVFLGGGPPVRVSYGYDRSSLCARVAAGGVRVDYAYDDVGRLTEVRSGAFALTVQGSRQGAPESLVGEQFESRQRYSAAGRLERVLVTAAGRPGPELSWVHDAHGNCTEKRLAGEEAWRLEYDARGWLTRATLAESTRGTAYDRSFAYDPAGNRVDDGSGALRYDAEGLQLEQDDRFTYSYDHNGNLTGRTETASGNQTSFEYDAFDRLVAVRETAADGSVKMTAEYGYDPLGRRVRKSVLDAGASQPVVRWYVHDRHNPFLELDGGRELRRHYVALRELDGLLGFVEDKTAFYFVRGMLGTVEAIFDQSGARRASYGYGPFGELLHEESTVANDFLFTCRELDRETGLYHLRARHYDPTTGRLLQRDPDAGDLAEPRTIAQMYAYADNNPLRFRDPTGEYSWGEFWDDVGQVGIGLLVGLSAASALGGLLTLTVGTGLLVTGLFFAISVSMLAIGTFMAVVGGVVGGLVGLTTGAGFLGGAKLGAQIGWVLGVAAVAVGFAVAFPPSAFASIPAGGILAVGGVLVAEGVFGLLDGVAPRTAAS